MGGNELNAAVNRCRDKPIVDRLPRRGHSWLTMLLPSDAMG